MNNIDIEQVEVNGFLSIYTSNDFLGFSGLNKNCFLVFLVFFLICFIVIFLIKYNNILLFIALKYRRFTCAKVGATFLNLSFCGGFCGGFCGRFCGTFLKSALKSALKGAFCLLFSAFVVSIIPSWYLLLMKGVYTIPSVLSSYNTPSRLGRTSLI